MKACLCCPFICNNNNKNNKKKSNLASPVPAGLLPLCSESVFILLSSFDIPTLKSWSVLSDPFIQAGGSWTLRKFNRLFSSGKDSVNESESLLVMLQRSHSSMPQYHTGQNHFWWKLRFVSVEDACLQSQYIVKISRALDKKKKGATEWSSVFSGSPSETKAENWTKNRAGLTDLHSTNFTKEHKSIIITPLRSYWYWISLVLFNV